MVWPLEQVRKESARRGGTYSGEAPIQEPHVQSSTPQREMDRLEERAGMQGREELELWSLAT